MIEMIFRQHMQARGLLIETQEIMLPHQILAKTLKAPPFSACKSGAERKKASHQLFIA